MITIGQLASHVGVTIKAIRHYHQRGLLTEPPRDGSGYRRYSAQHAIDLVKVKTLAEAGVPLARIKELLAADPDQLAAAIAEIDRNLRQRIDQLAQARERVAQLRGGDRLFVSSEVADYLDILRKIGVSEHTVQMERDGWILMQAVSPDHAAAWIADKRQAINDPEFRALYLDYDAAFDWPSEDPRLVDLANRAQEWTANRQRRATGPAGQPPDSTVTRLIDATSGSSPAWHRLTETAKQNATEHHATDN